MSIASHIIQKLNESSYSFTPEDVVLKKYSDGYSWVLSRDKKSVRRDISNLERQYNEYSGMTYRIISEGTRILVTLRDSKNVARASLGLYKNNDDPQKFHINDIFGYEKYKKYIHDFLNKKYNNKYFDCTHIDIVLESHIAMANDIKKNCPNINVNIDTY